MKIINDKYYTPKNIAELCVINLLKVIDKDQITEVIEPSIGNGAFCTSYLHIDRGIDIDPQSDAQLNGDFIDIIKGDYLQTLMGCQSSQAVRLLKTICARRSIASSEIKAWCGVSSVFFACRRG